MVNNWALLTPDLIVTAALLLVLILDFALPRDADRRALGGIGLLAALLALATAVGLWGQAGELFGGILVVDTLAQFFKVIFLAAAALVFLICLNYAQELPARRRGEFYWLSLTALLGMLVLAQARELITIYVGLELMSLSFYALVAYRREEKRSTEAALKYFILGSFAVAIWLYGAAMVFGLTGSTDLVTIGQKLGQAQGSALFLGLLLLVAGFAFKLGLTPFHMWLPDAYEGAPTPVTAFLAVGSKAAGFAVFLRTMVTSFAGLYANWAFLLGLIAALTMTWGNTAALHQTNIKRMLAYSSVAHAGYILIGVVSLNQTGMAAVLFYLFGYLFANAGAFAVIQAVARATGRENIEAFAGLRWRNPYLAFGLALCLLSLAGIPPLAGFFGKLYLFLAAVQQGGWLLALVIIAAINSAISLFYYVNVIRTMYFLDPEPHGALAAPFGLNLAVLVAVVGILLALFYFQPIVGHLAPVGALLANK